MCDSQERTSKTNERTPILARPSATREVQGLRETANDLLDLVSEDSDEMVRSESPQEEPRTLLDLASSCSYRLDHLDLHELVLHTLARQRDRPSIFESDKGFRTPNSPKESSARPREPSVPQPPANHEHLEMIGQAACEEDVLLSEEKVEINAPEEDEEDRRLLSS